ncbi:unnamed protein product [Rhodiola kirilowii]
MSMEQQPMLELTEHAIYLILLKSPVKSLKRFNSVSKRWREILTSSIFAKQHMKSVREATYSTASSSCNVIYSVAKNMRPHNNKESVRQFLSHRISSVEYGQQIIRPDMMMLRFSFNNNIDLYYSGLAEYQSCDGMLCMAQINDDVYSTWFIHVCNPATGEHKKLVWPRLFGDMLNRYGFMGFGYEASIDDYKVVVLVPSHHTGEWRAQIMSLKENTWRSVDDLKTTSPAWPSLVIHGKQLRSVCVNGDVYWIMIQVESSKESYGLLKFNLAEERLSLIPLPEGRRDMKYKCKLFTLNESLFLFTWKLDRVNPNIDMWMLQWDTTWCKAGTVPTIEYRPTDESPPILHPVGINMGGHIVMVNRVNQSLVVYIPQENKFEKLTVDGNNVDINCEDLYFHFVQMETLISP